MYVAEALIQLETVAKVINVGFIDVVDRPRYLFAHPSGVGAIVIPELLLPRGVVAVPRGVGVERRVEPEALHHQCQRLVHVVLEAPDDVVVHGTLVATRPWDPVIIIL